MRRFHLRRYGLTLEQYETRLLKQGGGCAICGGTDLSNGGRYLAVDHDAITGAVRGILCSLCNVGIGAFHHHPATMARAIIYLTAEVNGDQ